MTSPSIAFARKRHRVNGIGVFLVLMLSAGIAMAQAQIPVNPSLGDFMPKEGDMSLWVLKAIFGDWNADTQVPMLGAAMQQLNIFALAFGTLMFTWVSIIGTLNSAQDGEVLGRKWSSTWVPLRFIMGTGMMVPLSTGYSTAQHLILWLAMAGSGGGSAVWGHAMKGFAGSQAQTAVESALHQQKVEHLLKDVLLAEVCLAIKTESSQQAHGITVKPLAAPDGSTYRTTLQYGLPNTSEMNNCGEVNSLQYVRTSRSFAVQSATSGILGRSDAIAGASSGDEKATAAAMKTLIDQQTRAITMASEGPLREAAAQIAAKADANQNQVDLNDVQLKALVKSAIAKGVQIYMTNTKAPLAASVNTIKGDLDSFMEDSREAGWMMAGPAFFQMAAIRTKMNEVVSQTPVYSSSHLGDIDVAGLTTKDMVTDLDSINARIENGFAGDTSDSFNPGDSLAKWIGELVAFDPGNSDHAMVQIKNKGDAMMVTAQGIAVLVYGIDKAANAIPGVAKIAAKVGSLGGSALGGIFSELMKGAAPVIYTLAGVLFFAGIMMSLILPTLPFLMTTGAVLGWLMAVFSAVVAAPIWLAGHLNPDGDGFAGQRAAGGYMILLETATRPIFIILGLIGAFLILDPMCKFTAIAFSATINSVQANSTTGLASIAVLVCLYVVMIWTVVRTSLTLVYDLAQKVYTWIGGQFAGYEKAQEFAQGAQQANSSSARVLTEVKAGLSATMLRRDGGKGGGGSKE
ncbi:DotA/TraY family protein [Hydrogenophaga sp. 2FB]|uniref:DotA/TraY family protein n=1 Tax=Hydrogenophaga sp. 2FB TaxID=2502187 RepID=UPI0010F67B42|nr:DotA/TraY family protein [Hydrogenophaga sp. 2FB]